MNEEWTTQCSRVGTGGAASQGLLSGLHMGQGLLQTQRQLYKSQRMMLVANHGSLSLNIQPCDPEEVAVRVNVDKPDIVDEFRFSQSPALLQEKWQKF